MKSDSLFKTICRGWIITCVLLIGLPAGLHSENLLPEERQEAVLVENLTFFLSSSNEYLSDHMLDKDFFSARDYNNFVSLYYGVPEDFTKKAGKIQRAIEKVARSIDADPNTRLGIGSVLNHLFGPIDSRIDMEGELSPEQLTCWNEYARTHQACLIDAIVDGAFKSLNASVGASFFNCLNSAVGDFSDCMSE